MPKQRQTFTNFLIESSLENVLSKTKDVPEEIVTNIYDKIGDAYFKYVAPLSRLYKKNPFDIDELKSSLLKAIIKKRVDINRVSSFDELKSSVEDAIINETEDKVETALHGVYSIIPRNDPEFPIVFEKNGWRIYQLKSRRAALEYTPYKTNETMNLGWCTAMEDTNFHYTNYMDVSHGIFVFARNNKFRLQYAPLKTPMNGEEYELKKVHNHKITIEEVLETAPVLKPFFEKFGYKPFEGFIFNGNRIPKQYDEDGVLVLNKVDISGIGLTTLLDLPWVQNV